jgi:hypothetical protein
MSAALAVNGTTSNNPGGGRRSRPGFTFHLEDDVALIRVVTLHFPYGALYGRVGRAWESVLRDFRAHVLATRGEHAASRVSATYAASLKIRAERVLRWAAQGFAEYPGAGGLGERFAVLGAACNQLMGMMSEEQQDVVVWGGRQQLPAARAPEHVPVQRDASCASTSFSHGMVIDLCHEDEQPMAMDVDGLERARFEHDRWRREQFRDILAHLLGMLAPGSLDAESLAYLVSGADPAELSACLMCGGDSPLVSGRGSATSMSSEDTSQAEEGGDRSPPPLRFMSGVKRMVG